MLNPKSLRVLRTIAGLTQAQLADAIGVSPPTISNWETPPQPTEAQVKALAKALGCKAEDLGEEVEVR